MNYFSRIAKQSGLRYSRGSAKGVQPTSAEPTSIQVSPIEVDETIMVAPFMPDRPPKRGRAISHSTVTSEPQLTDVVPKQTSNTDQPVVQKRPAASAKVAERRPEIIETKPVISLPPDTTSHAPEPTVALPGKKAAVEPAAIKQTTMTAKESTFRPEPVITEEFSVEADESGVTSRAAIAPDTANKDYFIRTAEIIERGGAETVEIHQILFREIQQWAAESPSREEVSETPVEKTEPQITKQIVLPHQEGLAEQVFELSIGTINVVIEDEGPKQPESLPRTINQNTAQPPGREFSRLSRRYL